MITVRELQPEDDIKAVLNLCRDFFAEYEIYHDEFFDTDDLTDTDISGRFWESVKSNQSATIIAIIDNAIVGYALISVREQPDFYKIKKVGAVSGLMVAKNHRRKGIAKRLLAESKAYFRQKGVKYFTLYTAAANQGAAKFYEQSEMLPLHVSYIGKT